MIPGVEKIDLKSGFRYLHYERDSSSLRPSSIIVYLHGAGEFGCDTSLVSRYGLPLLLEQSTLSVNCDVVCPQMELDQQWDVEQLHMLVLSLKESGYNVVLSGFSRGGTGVCNYIATYGSYLSLAIVVAGRGLQGIECKLDGLAVVSIVGEDDPWPRMDRFLAEAKLKGAKIRDIPLSGCGHFISEEVFLSGELPIILSSYNINVLHHG